MPGPDGPWGDGLLDAVRAGDVSESLIDDKVLRLLRLAERVGALDGRARGCTTGPVADVDERGVLRDLVSRSMVVLRDDEHALPVVPDVVTRIALLGPNAVHPFVQGGGSAYVRPDHARRPRPRCAPRSARSRSTCTPARCPACCRPRSTWPGAAPPRRRRGRARRAGRRRRDRAGHHRRHRVDGWLREVPGAAVALRLRTAVRLEEPGRHEVGVGTVGSTGSRWAGRCSPPASGGRRRGRPRLQRQPARPGDAGRRVTEPTTVEIDALVQAVDAVGYASFARADLVHRVPGPHRTSFRGRRRGRRRRRRGGRGRRHQRRDRVRGLRPHDPGAARPPGRAGRARAGREPPHDRRGQRRCPCAPAVARRGAGVLWTWFPGQEWPDALADVLAGHRAVGPAAVDAPRPRGRRARPRRGARRRRRGLPEGLHVGYRGGIRLDRTPAAPFGHGLGWTTWEYEAVPTPWTPTRSVVLDVRVRNTGPRDGREVVQVYLEPPSADESGPSVGSAGSPSARVPARTQRRGPRARRRSATWDGALPGWMVPPGAYPSASAARPATCASASTRPCSATRRHKHGRRKSRPAIPSPVEPDRPAVSASVRGGTRENTQALHGRRRWPLSRCSPSAAPAEW